MSDNSFQPSVDNGQQSSDTQGTGFNTNVPTDSGKTDVPSQGKGNDVDISKILKRLDDSQAFIEQLKRERQEDRALIDQLKASKSSVDVDAIAEMLGKAGDKSDQTVDPDVLVQSVYDKVQETLTAKQLREVESTNFKQVADALNKLHGDKADEFAKQAAASVGMTLEDVVALSKKSPQAAKRILGIKDTVPTAPSPTNSGVNTLGLPSKAPEQKVSIMSARSEKERIAILQDRMKQHFGSV